MKLEIDISDDMEDTIVIASLKGHFEYAENYKPINDKDEKDNADLLFSLLVLIDYYGG